MQRKMLRKCMLKESVQMLHPALQKIQSPIFFISFDRTEVIRNSRSNRFRTFVGTIDRHGTEEKFESIKSGRSVHVTIQHQHFLQTTTPKS